MQSKMRDSALMRKGRNYLVDENLVFVCDIDSLLKLEELNEGLFVFVCTRGAVEVYGDDYINTVSVNDFMIIASEDLKRVKFIESAHFEFVGVYTSLSMLCNSYPDRDLRSEMVVLGNFEVYKLDESLVQVIHDHMNLVNSVWHGNLPVLYRTKVLHLQALSMLNIIQSIVLNDINNVIQKRLTDQPNRLFEQFIQILSLETNKRRPVEYYSAKLCISAKYLSSLCRRETGMSAYRIILDASVNEIKFALRNSDAPISVLAEQFEFTSISFFGQFVKKYTGMSPREYRNKKP